MMRFFWVFLLLPALAWAQVGDVGVGDSSNLTGELSLNPQSHSSTEGDFRVIFPGGCGKLVTKVPAEDLPEVDGEPAIRVVYTFCDRYQKKGEGCSVASYFNVTGPDGGYPEPSQVLDRVIKALNILDAAVKKEVPLRKELPDGSIIEGIDVYAAPDVGVATVWVRGLIYEGDIYILTAWNDSGNLWNDEDYAMFFNSFLPGAE